MTARESLNGIEVGKVNKTKVHKKTQKEISASLHYFFAYHHQHAHTLNKTFAPRREITRQTS